MVWVGRINAANRTKCQLQPSCRQDELEAGDELLIAMIRTSEIKANEKFTADLIQLPAQTGLAVLQIKAAVAQGMSRRAGEPDLMAAD